MGLEAVKERGCVRAVISCLQPSVRWQPANTFKSVPSTSSSHLLISSRHHIDLDQVASSKSSRHPREGGDPVSFQRAVISQIALFSSDSSNVVAAILLSRVIKHSFRSCWSELRCKSHPCDLPFGSASQHKFIPDEFVFTRAAHTVAWMERSVIREYPATLKSPGFHFVTSGLRYCQRVVSTRRPGSTRLD